MRTLKFTKKLDDTRIADAIGNAEAATSGEIRVVISTHKHREDVMVRAGMQFERLGMSSLPERNGVLLYIDPKTQKYAVIGDSGVHEKCGQEFWDNIAASMRVHMQREEFTEAVVHVVRRIGEMLAEHFPRSGSGPGQLSNDVVRD